MMLGRQLTDPSEYYIIFTVRKWGYNETMISSLQSLSLCLSPSSSLAAPHHHHLLLDRRRVVLRCCYNATVRSTTAEKKNNSTPSNPSSFIYVVRVFLTPISAFREMCWISNLYLIGSNYIYEYKYVQTQRLSWLSWSVSWRRQTGDSLTRSLGGSAMIVRLKKTQGGMRRRGEKSSRGSSIGEIPRGMKAFVHII